MKKLTLTLATLSTLALIGCGGSTSSSNSGTNSDGTAKDPQKIEKVEYTLNGSEQPICHNASHKSGISSSSTSMSCQWICGEYEGASPVHVLLSFEKIGGIWEFDDDYVSTSPVGFCHK